MALPQIGKPAPGFTSKAVLNDKVFDVSLSDFINKYVILLFYPLDFTCVGATELIAFSDHMNEFHEINATVIACSVDSHFSHLKWLSMAHKDGGIRGLRMPLIADKSMSIVKKYGVFDEEKGVAFRGMFIIDDKGIARQITVNDHPVGRSVPEACRLIKAIQQVDKMCEESILEAVEPEIATSSPVRKHRFLVCTDRMSARQFTE